MMSRPGDIILDRYLRGTSLEEREEARENLYRLAQLLVRVHERLSLEKPQPAIRAAVDFGLDSESPPPS